MKRDIEECEIPFSNNLLLSLSAGFGFLRAGVADYDPYIFSIFSILFKIFLLYIKMQKTYVDEQIQ